jgi:asparagine synthase (glutamine-hydrolysing)
MRWFSGVIKLDHAELSPEEIEKINYRPHQNYRVYKHQVVKKSFAFFSIDSSFDHNPITYYNNCYLVGDVRIDNREELLALLPYPQADMSDERLVLHLVQEKGLDVLNLIFGEFSFVIWDTTRQKILLVRDQIGIKTLFWTLQATTFYFASDIFLFESCINLHRLNDEYFIDFYKSNANPDSEITPFKDLFRIRSGTRVLIDPRGVSSQCYWSISNVDQSINYRDLNEYTEHLFHLLKESVQCRLNAVHPNAVLMSGGLDSTSVFAIAQYLARFNEDYMTFAVSGVFDLHKSCDEREYIDLVLQQYNTDPRFEVCDDYGIFLNFPHDTPFLFEPAVNAATYAFTRALIERCAKEGAKTILTGYGSDHVMGGSEAVLADLAGQLKLKALFQQIYPFALYRRLSLPKVLWHSAIAPHFNQGIIKDWTANRKADYINELMQIKSFNKKDFYRQFSGTKARIFPDRVIAAEFGVDIGHPYLDRRIIEFLYSIPGELRWNAGTPKWLLRRTMENKLPYEVVWRINKTNHLPLTFQGLRNSWPQLYPVVRNGRVSQFELIDLEEWRAAIEQWRQGYLTRDDLWVLLAIEIWLYRLEQKLNVA